MKTNHTPGPWEVFTSDEGRVWVQEVDTARGQLVVCDIPGDMETIEAEELANAALIAAAPELLAALEEALVLFAPEVFPGSETVGGVWLAQARAAIAKARGEEVL